MAQERQEIQKELDKWGPYEMRPSRSTKDSSSRHKQGRPRGSKKKMTRWTLWIGFTPKHKDDVDDPEVAADDIVLLLKQN